MPYVSKTGLKASSSSKPFRLQSPLAIHSEGTRVRLTQPNNWLFIPNFNSAMFVSPASTVCVSNALALH